MGFLLLMVCIEFQEQFLTTIKEYFGNDSKELGTKQVAMTKNNFVLCSFCFIIEPNFT